MEKKVIRICTELVSDRCPHIIPPENTKKAKISDTFRGYKTGTMFKNRLKIDFIS